MMTSTVLKVKPRQTYFKRLMKRKTFLFMAAPGMLWFLIFAYLPMFGIIVAFESYSYDLGFFKSKFIGLENFKFLFVSQDAYRIISNTIILNVIGIISGTIVCVTVAAILNELGSKWFLKVSQTILLMPYFISIVAVGYFANSFLNYQYGFLNRIVELFGSKPVLWYMHPEYWRAILTVVAIYCSFGINSIIYLAAIIAIPKDLYDAAEVDGAGKIRKFLSVTLPSITPTICILLLLSVGNMLRGNFSLIYIITLDQGPLYPTTDVIDTYVVRALRNVGDLGMSSAAGLFQSVAGFILVNISNYFVRRYDRDYALF